MLWGKIQMTDAQQKAAAKQFVKDWTGHGDENQESHEKASAPHRRADHEVLFLLLS